MPPQERLYLRPRHVHLHLCGQARGRRRCDSPRAAQSNPNYEIGVNIPGSPKPILVSGLAFAGSGDKLCERRFRLHACDRRDAGRAWGGGSAAGRGVLAAAIRTTNCKGIRAEVAGKGETCLDPGDPARREFQDCNGGFCGPAMVALPSGRYLRGLSPADVARALKDDPRADH